MLKIPKYPHLIRSSINILNLIAYKRNIHVKYPRSSLFAAKPSCSSVGDLKREAYIDVERINEDINNIICFKNERILTISKYSFSAKGKMIRPLLVILMAACANSHTNYSNLTKDNNLLCFKNRRLESKVTTSQHAIAVISEMIHTASLIHDDLLDNADKRRGKLAAYKQFGNKKAILIGDIILVKASEILAKVNNSDVVSVLSTVLDDLIRGELMQMSSDSDENQRFCLYLDKTYRKTASLMANSCKAVTLLSSVDATLVDAAYSFGRNLGMAFQLLDDVFDFIAQESNLGKPAGGSDLQLGLATGPVLFAAQQFPELDNMMQNGFQVESERQKACSLVHQSDGVGQTRMLAEFHFQEAQRQLGHFKPSDARECLLQVAAATLLRNK